jgi:hypothetical protein
MRGFPSPSIQFGSRVSRNIQVFPRNTRERKIRVSHFLIMHIPSLLRSVLVRRRRRVAADQGRVCIPRPHRHERRCDGFGIIHGCGCLNGFGDCAGGGRGVLRSKSHPSHQTESKQRTYLMSPSFCVCRYPVYFSFFHCLTRRLRFRVYGWPNKGLAASCKCRVCLYLRPCSKWHSISKSKHKNKSEKNENRKHRDGMHNRRSDEMPARLPVCVNMGFWCFCVVLNLC